MYLIIWTYAHYFNIPAAEDFSLQWVGFRKYANDAYILHIYMLTSSSKSTRDSSMGSA